ncbi:M64 family metallopeptidase [Oerskovia sp. M15]
MPDSVTQILRSGPPGTKINIAVVGDGFAAGDQAAYNAKVQDLIIDGVFGNDYFYEDASAFNVFRVNLISNDSGSANGSTTSTARRATPRTTRSPRPRCGTPHSGTSTPARGLIAGWRAGEHGHPRR